LIYWGEPNRKLSNSRELRYGDNGKLTVKIRGERSGSWYDFSREKGVDMFSLARDVRGGSFKDAAEYLRQSVGMGSSASIGVKSLVDETKEKYRLEALKEEKMEQEKQDKLKLAYVDKLYARGKDIGQ